MKSKTQVFRFVFFCIFFPAMAAAQSDFQNGYVITLTQDTLYGLINNMDYYENSQYCEFQETGTESVKRFYPWDITGYRFTDGKYYISKMVDGNQLFMEYMINGILDIYFYQDENGDNHYYAAKDSLDLHELKYSKEIRYLKGKSYEYESKLYIGVLNYLTQDCGEMADDLQSAHAPNHQNLIGFAKEYHNYKCKGEQCIIYEKKIPRKIKVAVYGGSNLFFSTISNLDRKLFSSFGYQFMFQQAQRRERLYIGIGLFSEGKMDLGKRYVRIPFSVNYLSQSKGFSPCFAYEFDLRYFGSLQAFKIGLKYQMKKFSFLLLSDIKTSMFVIPIAWGANLGIMYDIR